jgi:hypothetical protein
MLIIRNLDIGKLHLLMPSQLLLFLEVSQQEKSIDLTFLKTLIHVPSSQLDACIFQKVIVEGNGLLLLLEDVLASI